MPEEFPCFIALDLCGIGVWTESQLSECIVAQSDLSDCHVSYRDLSQSELQADSELPHRSESERGLTECKQQAQRKPPQGDHPDSQFPQRNNTD